MYVLTFYVSNYKLVLKNLHYLHLVFQLDIEMLDLSHDLVFMLNMHHPHDHYSNPQKNHLMRTTKHLMMTRLTIII